MPSSDQLPRFTALLFGLSGGLVDFGARTLSLALLRSHPHSPAEHLRDASLLPFAEAQSFLLQRKPEQERAPAPGAGPRRSRRGTGRSHRRCRGPAGEPGRTHGFPTPGSGRATGIGLPAPCRAARPSGRPDPLAGARLAGPRWLLAGLARLGIERLDGCVLVSAQPRQLQAGLNAGLWTIGLAASGPSCGSRQPTGTLSDYTERDRLRADATLELYRLGVHSVIDHLGELQPCLHDLAVRRLKGEKP